jgi:ubiquinone/menaquinone biosynthesis C-methylase UbiE
VVDARHCAILSGHDVRVSPASEQYVIRGGQQGYERLTVLARSWRPTTAALFDRVQLGEGMRCLDLGCGSGDVTFEMAQRVGPDGSVTGVDMDEVKLGLARAAAAAQGLANVEFRAMNIYELAEPDSYDLVYSRFVLQHLGRPVDVLRSMWAAVSVGGVIVVTPTSKGLSVTHPTTASPSGSTPTSGFWSTAVAIRLPAESCTDTSVRRAFPSLRWPWSSASIGSARPRRCPTPQWTPPLTRSSEKASRRLRRFRRRSRAWPSSVLTRTAFVAHLASSRSGLAAPRNTPHLGKRY